MFAFISFSTLTVLHIIIELKILICENQVNKLRYTRRFRVSIYLILKGLDIS